MSYQNPGLRRSHADLFGGPFGKMRIDARLRRFAVECCRRVRHLISEPVFRAAAGAGEAHADDPCSEKGASRVIAKASIEAWRHRRHYELSAGRQQFRAANAATATCASTDWHAAFHAMQEAAQAANRADPDSCDPGELQYQAALLRCLFGPLLFRRKRIGSTWLTWNGGTVLNIARAVHDGNAFERLPVLADALEEAGCADPDILSHCRGTGPHLRGCWVIELLLGRQPPVP
jgi:hypothetical protein